MNSNTTLDITVNTDFAQVEADAQQFNLSRFSLVYPEKRKFFLERANVFEFGLGGPNTLFYSRRIGLYDGNPVRILGGVRLMNSANGWDIGFMDMQTARYSDLLPSENFGVFRVKKKIFNDNSYAGSMLTSRIGMDGTYNLAYGLDAVVRLFGDEYLTARWAQTFDEKSDKKFFSLDPTRFYLDWTRRRNKGLSYTFLTIRSGEDFDPGIGLEVFDNYYVYQALIKYSFIPKETSSLQIHVPSLTTYTINDVRNDSLLTYKFAPAWQFLFKSGWNAMVSMEYNYEYLTSDLEISDEIIIPMGGYRFWDGMIMLQTPFQKAFKVVSSLTLGSFYDGIRVSPQLNPIWNLSNSVEMGATYVFDYLNFSDRSMKLANHIFGLRGLYMMSTKLSFSGFIQYNTAIDKVISNLRFRYNPREGTDLYLVFNEGRNTYLTRETPVLPAYDYRSVMVKYNYTFDL